MQNRAKDWLKQAENDLSWAHDTLKAGKYAQACFICQQVAEKALKAIAYKSGFDMVKSHSVMEIAKMLDINGDIESMGKRLNQYYISTRYPDAVPSGAPYEYYSHDQAEEAIGFASKIITFAQGQVHER